MRVLFPGVLAQSCISKCVCRCCDEDVTLPSSSSWCLARLCWTTLLPELNTNTTTLLPRCCGLMQYWQENSALQHKNNQCWCLMCEEWRFLGQGRPLSVLMPEPSLEVWWEWTSEAGLPRSWPINSFEVFAVRVLLLWLQGLRVLQEVFIPLVLGLDVGADGGGALTLKATGQSCREKQVPCKNLQQRFLFKSRSQKMQLN